jgi:hypothetical protein
MLRIECYPSMDGVLVSLIGTFTDESPLSSSGSPARVTRHVSLDTIEHLGMDEAIRDVIVDVVSLYPGLLSFALR